MEAAVVEVPDKSRSLRQSSVKRRLEVERSRREPKQRKKLQKMTLSKYRRKCANAKERQRMQEVNDMFTKLKNIVPEGIGREQDDKDTKVTTLRSAICYISELQKLLTDYDAGMLDPTKYQDENLQPANGRQPTRSLNNTGRRRPLVGQKRGGLLAIQSAKSKRQIGGKSAAAVANGSRRLKQPVANGHKVAKERRVVLRPKWTDYSGSLTLAGGQTDCGQSIQPVVSFNTSPDGGAPASNSSSFSSLPASTAASYVVSAGPYLPSDPPSSLCLLSPASPRDVNVISLYISLIDNSRD